MQKINFRSLGGALKRKEALDKVETLMTHKFNYTYASKAWESLMNWAEANWHGFFAMPTGENCDNLPCLTNRTQFMLKPDGIWFHNRNWDGEGWQPLTAELMETKFLLFRFKQTGNSCVAIGSLKTLAPEYIPDLQLVFRSANEFGIEWVVQEVGTKS